MLSLPESLLLFALHDERGSVHSAAFLGLDEALRCAVLGELMLRGMIKVRRDGATKVVDDPPDDDSILLLLAYRQILDQRPDTIEGCLSAIQKPTSRIRKRLVNGLVTKKVITSMEIDRENLADTDVHKTADSGPEAQMLQHVREGIAAGAGVTRRIGVLIGLTHVLNLWGVLLEKDEREAARAAGDWVLERDAIVGLAKVVVAKADGTWEG